MKTEVFCFYDGSYSVCLNGKVVAQGHWSKLIAEHIEQIGHDPEEAKIMLANGMLAKFKQKDNSWRCNVLIGKAKETRNRSTKITVENPK